MIHPNLPLPIRVLLVDDHETMLWGLERLIEAEAPRMLVVGKASTARQARARALETEPDVVLLDIDLGYESGLDLLPELVASGARVLILTGLSSRSVQNRAMSAGASGVVSKRGPASNIVAAIQKAHGGERWLDCPSVLRRPIQFSRRTLAGSPWGQKEEMRLTPREREIIQILARETGMSIVQIARQQHISERTLRNQLTSIYAKLGISSRLELNVYTGKHQVEQ